MRPVHRECVNQTDVDLCVESEPRSVLTERGREVNLAGGWEVSCCCWTLWTCFCWLLSSELNSWFACSLKCSSKPQNALHISPSSLSQL